MTGQTYINQILEKGVFPLSNADIIIILLQQDNTPCHTARKVITHLQDSIIKIIYWPPNIADLNIIVNIWKIRKSKLTLKSIRTKSSLIQETKAVWDKISQEDMINKLIERQL